MQIPFLDPSGISEDQFISDIVRTDYRTARVFKKYEIDFCCGGKWALGAICSLKGIDFSQIKKELEHSIRNIQLSNTIKFDNWSIDFLTDYIVNIHHHYLRDELPLIKDQLERFTRSHVKKYPYLEELSTQFEILYSQSSPHMTQEEEVLFPYIRQIDHAFASKEPYASLLVRTLRKPVESFVQHQRQFITDVLEKIRRITNNYQPPDRSCVSHHVTYHLLKELDNDLSQHLYLENQVLFPKALAMEKELLMK